MKKIFLLLLALTAWTLQAKEYNYQTVEGDPMKARIYTLETAEQRGAVRYQKRFGSGSCSRYGMRYAELSGNRQDECRRIQKCRL